MEPVEPSKHLYQNLDFFWNTVQPLIKFPSYADLLKVADGFCELLIAFMACLKGLFTDRLVATLIKVETIEPPSTALSTL